MQRLYVSNLAWNVSSQALKKYFQQFGEVKHSFVNFDKKTGFSKCFGCVDFVGKNFIVNVDRVDRHYLNGLRLHLVFSHRSRGQSVVAKDEYTQATRHNDIPDENDKIA